MSRNRIAQVVPKDGLNRFMDSFANLTKIEDLADDSDSNDEGEVKGRTSGENNSFVQAEYLDDSITMLNSICSICLPQIERHLFEPLGSAKSVDTVVVRLVVPQYIIFTN
jgi:hypothetical protein